MRVQIGRPDNMKKLISLTPVLILKLGCVGLLACGGAALSSDDREKFVGNWVRSYRCGSIGAQPVPDPVVIARGSGDLDFVITMHVDFLNPDIANGKLTDIDVVTVLAQNMGGARSTARITYSNNMLTLTQAGFGITCEGTDYVKSDGLVADSDFHPQSLRQCKSRLRLRSHLYRYGLSFIKLGR